MSAEISEKLLIIFPNEVWSIILANVTMARDYQKICGVSILFQSFLKPRRVQILFSDVARLVQPYLAAEYRAYSPCLLSCRKVCRSWKAGVDHVLQNPTYYYSFPSEIPEDLITEQEEKFDKKLFEEVYNIPRNIASFQQQFEETHHSYQANPFVSRGIVHKVWDIPFEDEKYWSWIQFLEKYGHHIWYYTVDLELFEPHDVYPTSNLELYTKLSKILHLMPNLRVFEFLTNYGPSVGERLMEAWQKSDDAAKQVQFPTLPHLHFLDLTLMPPVFVQDIAQKNPQVRFVDARVTTPEILKIYLEKLPNLTRLAIVGNGIERYNNNTIEFLHSIHNAKLSCRMESLRLNANSLRGPWNEVFATLKAKFSDTLTELYLELPALDEKFYRGEGIRLAKLKMLTLKTAYVVPLDFLLPLAATLEQLFLKGMAGDWKEAEKKEKVVKLYGFEETLEKSNMWTLFPKLRILST